MRYRVIRNTRQFRTDITLRQSRSVTPSTPGSSEVLIKATQWFSSQCATSDENTSITTPSSESPAPTLRLVSEHTADPIAEGPSPNLNTALLDSENVTSEHQTGSEDAVMDLNQELSGGIGEQPSANINATPWDLGDGTGASPIASENIMMGSDQDICDESIQSSYDEVMHLYPSTFEDILIFSFLQSLIFTNERSTNAVPNTESAYHTTQIQPPRQTSKSFKLDHKFFINGKSRYLKTRWIRDDESGRYECVCQEQVSDKLDAEQHLSKLSPEEFTGKHGQKYWNPLIGRKV